LDRLLDDAAQLRPECAAHKLVKFIPGPDNIWTVQMTLHDKPDNDSVIEIDPWGADPTKPNDEGIVLWDISDPVYPKLLSHWD
jgi:hypothetical protein